jgi:exodeoxyribonuclease-5
MNIEFDPQASLVLVPHQSLLQASLAEMARQNEAPLIGPSVKMFSPWMGETFQALSMLSGKSFPGSADRWLLSRLWGDAISSDLGFIPPAERAALAEQAMQADRLLCQWTTNTTGHEGRHPWRRFLIWRSAVHDQLEALHLVTQQQIPWLLGDLLDKAPAPPGLLPSSIRLKGFAELTVAEKQLLRVLEAQGVEVSVEATPVETATPRLLAFGSPEEELAAAASWARDSREAGLGRIGLVVNGLENMAEPLRELLENALHPAAAMRLDIPDQADFCLSVGSPLVGHPLVQIALLLLDLAEGGLRKQHEFSMISAWLLSSGWAGSQTERVARADLELELRRNDRYRWSLARLAERASARMGSRPLPKLLDCINRIRKGGSGSHATECIRNWLSDWGWATEAGADSAGRAVLARFTTLLERFSRMEFSTTAQCLSLLRKACASETYTYGGGALSPVQVMTPDQAYGQRFDALRVVNLTAENWPGQATINPLLPLGAENLVPRLADAGQRRHCERLTEALVTAAPEVILSHAAFQGDTPVEPSYLLRGLEVLQSDYQGDGALWRFGAPRIGEGLAGGDNPWLQASREGNAPALQGQIKLPGMITTMAYQSACPLAACLAVRLNARFEPPPEPFASPAFAGQLVHVALERLYLPHAGVESRPQAHEIPRAVEHALEYCHAHYHLHTQILKVEQERLQVLLAEWLEYETLHWAHGPVRLEHRESFGFEGFVFELRLDRLDQLKPADSGDCFLFDYKTGSDISTNQWARSRLGNPQLPLYAVLLNQSGNESLAGIGFARVRQGQMAYGGISGDPLFAAPGLNDLSDRRNAVSRRFNDWADCLAAWEQSLRGLAREFRAGDCTHQLHDEDALAYAGLELVMRSRRAQAWLEKGGECDDN